MQQKSLVPISSIGGLIKSSPEVLNRLIEREKRIIERAQEEIETLKARHFSVPFGISNTITMARRRISALQAGLAPVRIEGDSVPLTELVRQRQAIPPQIVERAGEAEKRFPGARSQVYGLNQSTVTEVRRRRDPVLIMEYGDAHFFLGFWMEIETGDVQVPEFFGMIAPMLPPRGRGRPRKDELL